MDVDQIHESTKHRILESADWKELQEFSSPVSISNYGQLWEQIGVSTSWVLKSSRDGDCTSSWATCFIAWLSTQWVFFFLMPSQWLSHFSLCPLLLILQSCTAEEGLTPSSCWLPCTCRKDAIRFTWREESLLLGLASHPLTMLYAVVAKTNYMAKKLCHGGNETFAVGQNWRTE